MTDWRLIREMVSFFGPTEAGIIFAFCIWWGLSHPTLTPRMLEQWIIEQRGKKGGLTRPVVYRRMLRLRLFRDYIREKYRIPVSEAEIAEQLARQYEASGELEGEGLPAR